jgi:mRNA interferase RelE/StbE
VTRYTVRVRGAARKEHDALPPEAQRRVLERLTALEGVPRPHGAERLAGELAGLYRIRVGDYRVVYQVDDEQRMVNVVRVRPRGRAYR